MTLQTQVGSYPQPVSSRLQWFFSETAYLFLRSTKKLLRRPVALYFSLIQPAVWLLLFGQIFNRIASFPGAAAAFGGTSYFQFFMPAVILQTLLFGAAQSGIGIISDMDSGFLSKLLTTPINRMSILLGKILADLTRMLIQGGMIVLIAWIFGQFQSQKVRYANGLPGLAGALGVALLFGLMLASVNVIIALKTKNTESTFLVSNFITLPLLFTSSANLPIQLLPDWLQQVAKLNPVTYAVDAMRILFNGSASVPGTDPATLISRTVIVLAVLSAIALLLAVRSFRASVA